MMARRGVVASVALAVAAVALAAGVALRGGSAAIVAAVFAQLFLEGGKTLFLMKRFRGAGCKNGVVGVMIVEAVTFVCACGLAALLVWVTDGASKLEPAAFCMAFIAFRLSSGILLAQKG